MGIRFKGFLTGGRGKAYGPRTPAPPGPPRIPPGPPETQKIANLGLVWGGDLNRNRDRYAKLMKFTAELPKLGGRTARQRTPLRVPPIAPCHSLPPLHLFPLSLFPHYPSSAAKPATPPSPVLV